MELCNIASTMYTKTTSEHLPGFGSGGQDFFFENLHAMRIARGFGGMLSEKSFKTMQFGAF